MRLYDLMLLLDPNVPDDRHREILGNVNSAIEGKGKLVGQHDWGMRRMAFEIDHRGDAAYHLFQFEAESDLLDQLDNTLKITDGVLRHRIIKVKPGTPPPPTPAPGCAPRAAREPEDAGGTVAARAAADAPPRTAPPGRARRRAAGAGLTTSTPLSRPFSGGENRAPRQVLSLVSTHYSSRTKGACTWQPPTSTA